MTSRSYFGKMNSTLGSVVPLAMFLFVYWLLVKCNNSNPSNSGSEEELRTRMVETIIFLIIQGEGGAPFLKLKLEAFTLKPLSIVNFKVIR